MEWVGGTVYNHDDENEIEIEVRQVVMSVDSCTQSVAAVASIVYVDTGNDNAAVMMTGDDEELVERR